MAKLPKRPKKPKASAPLTSWEKYDQRVKAWQNRIAKIKADKKRKESLIKKYS